MEKVLPKKWIPLKFEDFGLATDYVANGSFKSLKENVIQTEEEDYAILVRLKDFSKNWKGPFRYVTKDSYEFLKKSSLKPGDLFVANVGYPGKAFFIPDLGKPMTIGPNGLRIRTNKHYSTKFLYYFFRSLQGESLINNISSGTAQQKFNKTGLRKSYFPLPPLAEQERIVTKLDDLFARLDKIKASLDKIPQLLQNFRQQVLTQAVTGKLTEEWREGRDTEEWTETTIGQLFEVKTGATPKRGNPKYYENGHIPWLKSGQVKNELIFSAEEYITDLAIKETNAKVFPIDTLLVAMYGEGKTRGQVGWMKISAASNQAIAALVNENMNNVTKSFVYHFCLSQYNEIRALAEGGNQPNLNLSKIKNWNLSLPPIDEQQKILNKVESLFAKADKIQEKYKLLRGKIEQLPQAILYKAFKGELVSQLESDGDAIELLREIEKLKKSKK